MKTTEVTNYTIYGIYEKDSGACLYVGETSLKLSRRLTHHATKKNCVMYPVIQELGRENIEIRPILTIYGTGKMARELESNITNVFLKADAPLQGRKIADSPDEELREVFAEKQHDYWQAVKAGDVYRPSYTPNHPEVAAAYLKKHHKNKTKNH